MVFPWNNNKPPVVQPASPASKCQLEAAVLVCDTFLTFDNDAAVYHWAAEILKHINSDYQLARKANVEAVVGYKGNKNVLYTNMQELLHLMLNRRELRPDEYVMKLFEIEIEAMRIWCAVAVCVCPNSTTK